MLKSLVEMSDGKITQEQLVTVAKGIYEQNEGVRAVQYLPDGVVTYCYPIEGNEAALGHHLLADPDRKREVLEAISMKKAVLAGPVNIRQGGTGLFVRMPVFIEEGGEKRLSLRQSVSAVAKSPNQ